MRTTVSGIAALGVATTMSLACGQALHAPVPAAPVAAAPSGCGRAHPGVGATPLAVTRAGGTVALAEYRGKTLAYVADEDNRAVHVIDVDGKELGSALLDGRPSQLLLLPDGRLVVALRDVARIVVLEPTANLAAGPFEQRCSVESDAEPVGLALSPDDATLVVTHAAGRSLAARDAKSADLGVLYSVAMPREPRSVIVSDDGQRAFVAHAVGGQATVVDLAKRQLTAVPLHRSASTEKSRRVAVEAACQGFALAKTAPERPRVLVPQVIVDPGDTAQQPSGYGTATSEAPEQPDIAVLDSKSGDVLPSSLGAGDASGVRGFVRNLTGKLESECLLPRAAAYDAATRSLLVGCFGIDKVVAYDAEAANPVVAEKQRWAVPSGPSGLAVDPAHHRAVVWSQFERTLAVLPLEEAEAADVPKASKEVARIALASTPRLPPLNVALGRILFHTSSDVRISRDGRACASCHPDGRDDGLTWATPNGPRRSISLSGRVASDAPFSWSGSERTFEAHAEITFERLSGTGGLRGLELTALAAYVESLPAPPAPRVSEALAARGHELFDSTSVGCASCHTGERATDNAHHDVKSKTSSDRSGSFKTPSLRFVGRGGPYFHDGRYPTLHNLLLGTDGTMGHTKQLSESDLAALETYLRSL